MLRRVAVSIATVPVDGEGTHGGGGIMLAADEAVDPCPARGSARRLGRQPSKSSTVRSAFPFGLDCDGDLPRVRVLEDFA